MSDLREALVQARARVVEALRDAGDTATYHTEDLRQVIAQCDAALGDKQPRKPDPPTATATVAMPGTLREALAALAIEFETPAGDAREYWQIDCRSIARRLRQMLARHPAAAATDARQRRHGASGRRNESQTISL